MTKCEVPEWIAKSKVNPFGTRPSHFVLRTSSFALNHDENHPPAPKYPVSTPLYPFLCYSCAMNFKQRLLRFLIGVAIGCAVVFFMFPNYDWLGWTPQKRMKEDLRDFPFSIDSCASYKMQCYGLTDAQLQLAKSDGSFDFEKSDVKANPRRYHLNYGDYSFIVAMSDTTSELIDVMNPSKVCMCP